MAGSKKDKYSFLDNPKRLLVGGAVVGIGGFILYKLGRKIFTTIRERNTAGMADDSPAVRQAMALRSAVNPSGAKWMKSFDFTNVSAIMETAKQITNLDDVITAYRKLYDAELLKDLQSDLGTSDYQKFLTIVSSNTKKTSGVVNKFAEKNQLVVAKAEVFLRSSPDASYHGAIYEINANKNIIRKAKIGEFLGYATGSQHYDEKNNVKFIEVAYLVKKDGLPAAMKPYAGKQFRYWVSASSNYVEIFPYYSNMFAKYPSTQQEVSYKKPLTYYSGVKGFAANPVISVKPAHVLDEKMQPFILVQPRTLLGEYIMSLDTGKTKYIKFRTIDNTERWVRAGDVTIKNQ
jgi:hypothetical protein